MKKVVLVVFVLIFVILLAVVFLVTANPCPPPICEFPLPENFTWEGRVSGDITYDALLFKGLNNYVNLSSATYYFTAQVTNLENKITYWDYSWYVCRCKNYSGSEGVESCLEYWPFANFTAGDWPWYSAKCVQIGPFHYDFAPYESINVTVNVSQHKNQPCGMLQANLNTWDVDGVWGKGYSASGGVTFCKDCVLSYCGDGILDSGEECDDGNNIDGDGCDADCTVDKFEFCEEFDCYGCFFADFLGNEPNEKYPNDCITVIVLNEGTYYPKCYPTTCID